MANKEQVLNKDGLIKYDSLIKQYTNQLIETYISNLIDSAPEHRDTLIELSNAIDANSDILTTLNSAITSKVNKTDLTAHTSNIDIHSTIKKSSTNGNILINDVETVVYTHPSGTNPHGTTAADVGLGNVNNTADEDKRVLYATSSGSSTYASSSTKASQDDNGNAIILTYETKTDATNKSKEAKDYTDDLVAQSLNSAKDYTNQEVSKKTIVQIIRWEADD